MYVSVYITYNTQCMHLCHDDQYLAGPIRTAEAALSFSIMHMYVYIYIYASDNTWPDPSVQLKPLSVFASLPHSLANSGIPHASAPVMMGLTLVTMGSDICTVCMYVHV